MEFLAQIVDSLAWPITVLILVIMLRSPLSELIPLLKKLKYKEFEVEFDRELDAISQATSEAKQEAEVPYIEMEPGYIEYMEATIVSAPRAAIMESWIRLENTVIETTRRYLLPENERIHLPTALHALLASNAVSESNIKLIYDLRALRNKAVHELDFSITEKEARKFVDAASDLGELVTVNVKEKFDD